MLRATLCIMALKFNVDFLRRSDLMFELYCRGQVSNEVVEVLRKKLRTLLSQEIFPDKKNILIEHVPEQLALCRQNLEILKNDFENLCETTSKVEVSRLRDRVGCFINRLSLLREVCTDNSLDDLVTDFDDLLQLIQNLFSDLNNMYPPSQSITSVTNPAFPTVATFENLNTTNENRPNPVIPSGPSLVNVCAPDHSVPVVPLAGPSVPQPVHVGTGSVPSLPVHNPSVNPPVHPYACSFGSIYSKLPHPVIKLLNELPVADGFSVDDLLKFFRLVLRIISAFPDLRSCIFPLLVPHVRGQLLNLLLSNQESSNFDSFHCQALSSFIPERQLSSIKQNLFLRKQADDEKLAEYVRDIRESAAVLRLGLSEEQIVSTILEGINFKVRACCTFCARPRNFADLDRLCIDVMNVQFIHRGGAMEKSTGSAGTTRVLPRPSPGSSVICHHCHRAGHIRPQCPVLQRRNSKNL